MALPWPCVKRKDVHAVWMIPALGHSMGITLSNFILVAGFFFVLRFFLIESAFPFSSVSNSLIMVFIIF